MKSNGAVAPQLGIVGEGGFRIRRPRLVYSHDESLASDKATGSRILIVEDDFLVASQMEIALEDAGLEIAGVAQSADEALKLVAERRPRLAIMDIRLAGRNDGVYAAVELYRRHGVRCIFATAHSDDDVRQRGQAANPIGWIQKPYSMRALVEAVRKGLAEIDE
jgi:DNA-binding NarL/FixJ family response regulator